MLQFGLSLLGFNALGAVAPAMQHVLQMHCCFASKATPPYLKDTQKTQANTKDKPSKAKDPSQKRAPSGYVLFIKDRSAGTPSPGVKQTDKLRQLAAEWKSMTAEQKAPYMDEAAALKAKTMQARGEAKGTKRPPSAYNQFYKEQYPMLASQGLKVTQAAGEIGKLWKALPEEERASRKAAADKVFEAWKTSKAS